MQSNKEWLKARYKRLKELGLCVKCKAPTRDGRACCDACNANQVQYIREHAEQVYEQNQQRYRSRREKGLCGQCGKPAENGKSMCAECAQRHREANRKSRARRQARDRAGVQQEHQAD